MTINHYPLPTNIMATQIELNTKLSYTQEWTEDTCLNIHEISGKNLANELVLDMPFWNPLYPVFITAPTGSGKNYFTEKYLIPFASGQSIDILSENNIYQNSLLDTNVKRKILIVSDRVALNVQIKKRLCNQLNLQDILDSYTDIGFQNKEDFDNVTLLTYHKLWDVLNNPKMNGRIKQFEYVVFDECHFFYSDANFVPYSSLLLDLLPKRFSHSVRIYMTATPKQIAPFIIKSENSTTNIKLTEFSTGIPFHVETYIFSSHFKKNINYRYAKSSEAIISLINEDQSNNKWLWFVNSRKTAEEIQLDLKCTSTFISADSKESNHPTNKDYLSLLSNEKFESKVLLCTTVINNGINIKDSEFVNIVLSSLDETEILQMIGRKRFSSEQDRLTIYFKAPSSKFVSYRHKHHATVKSAIQQFKYDPEKCFNDIVYGQSEISATFRNLLFRYRGKTVINTIGKHKLYNSSKIYEFLLNSESICDNAVKHFLNIVDTEDSFNNHNYIEVRTSADNPDIQSIISFLDSQVNLELDDKGQATFRETLHEIWPESLKKRKYTKASRIDGKNSINLNIAYLNLPYEITSKKVSDKTLWQLIRTSCS